MQRLCARGSDEIGGHVVGLPIVSRVYLGYFSVLADQDRAQPVDNLPVLLVISQAEEVGSLAHLFRGTRGELPVGEAGIDTSHVMLAIAAQDLGFVVFRIDADAEQLRFVEHLRIFLQLLHDLAEVVAHASALVLVRTTRVDECEYPRFAVGALEQTVRGSSKSRTNRLLP